MPRIPPPAVPSKTHHRPSIHVTPRLAQTRCSILCSYSILHLPLPPSTLDHGTITLTMADLQGRKVFKVFNQDFIVDERYTVTKELGQGAYGIVW